jgi:hypothetical protein
MLCSCGKSFKIRLNEKLLITQADSAFHFHRCIGLVVKPMHLFQFSDNMPIFLNMRNHFRIQHF